MNRTPRSAWMRLPPQQAKSKLESQENDMNAIERKNSAYSRPMLASSALEHDPHHSAFGAYLRWVSLRGLNPIFIL